MYLELLKKFFPCFKNNKNKNKIEENDEELHEGEEEINEMLKEHKENKKILLNKNLENLSFKKN
jgi:hypothetical protein